MLGTTNTFTLQFAYDPFKFGQQSSDEIEALDELIVKAMSHTIEDDHNGLKCYIQYGYSGYDGSDNSLVSPKYELYMTDIRSQVQTTTGLISYTIEGVSILSEDCSFVTTFEQITTEDNISPLTVVVDTLYKYYGDKNNPPSHLSNADDYIDNIYKYRIDIPDEYFSEMEDQQVACNTKEDISPWKYCQDILDTYNMTKSDIESGQYDDMSKIPINKQPRWYLFLTDTADGKTIRLTHVSPLLTKENDVENTVYRLNKGFTWGTQEESTGSFWSNLAIAWNPKVDLRQYIIQKAIWLRQKNEANAQMESALNNMKKINSMETQGPFPESPEERREKAGVTEDYKTSIKKYEEARKALAQKQEENWEYYESTLTLLGIPADPVINTEVKVVPRILEKTSRQSGIYIILGMTDKISNNGTYISELNLFRVDNLNNTDRKLNNKTTSNNNENFSLLTGGGGSTGGSGASGSF